MSIRDFFRKLFSRSEASAPQLEETQRELPPEERFILCLDGGGMRGIATVAVLKELEKKLQDLGCDKSLASCFDLIAGTSTGGLIALALSCPSSLEHVETSDGDEVYLEALLDTYRTMGDEIFPNSMGNIIGFLKAKRYPASGIERLLKSWFEDHSLEEAKVPTLIMSHDISQGTPVLLRSWEDKSFPVWEAGRATSAAPTYFKPFVHGDMAMVDGGVPANNPAIYAYAQAKKLYPNCKVFHMLSLGTGGKPLSLSGSELNMGILGWADSVSPMYLTAQKYTTDYTMALFDDVDYIRIDDEMEQDIKMDETDPELIMQTELFGYRMAAMHDSQLSLFAQRLAVKDQRSV